METLESTASSDIQAAIDAGIQIGLKQAPIYTENGLPIFVIPKEYKVEAREDFLENPRRVSIKVEHDKAQSFIDYLARFGTDQSAIFLDSENNTFTAIIDYHSPDKANHLKHRSVFKAVKTKEWEKWHQNNGKIFTQEGFGNFIEDNLEEIIKPSGAEMLEIALSMQANTNIKFNKAIRLDNGQVQLQYHEEINGQAGTNGQLKIPQTFTIGLRLFEGCEAYQIEARLKYRLKDASLAIWYELIRPHKTIDANINQIIETIKNAKLPVHFYEATGY